MAKLVIKTDGLPAEVLNLNNGRQSIGRSSENDFQILHDSLSRFHCEIEVKEDALFVRDLDSSNGTYLDDVPVKHVQLESGHFLRLGEVCFEVTDASPPSSPDAVSVCINHPTFPASMRCTQCGRLFCGPCIHILKLAGGKAHKLCPACSGHCESLQGMNEKKKVKKGLLGNLVQKLFKR